MKKHLFLFFIVGCLRIGYAQVLPYKNSQLPVQERVQDLLLRMTPEEKFRQLFMVAGDLGTDSLRFKEGIFGFQINTGVQQVGATNQLMHYEVGQSALHTAQKINAIQRYFVEDTRLGIPIIAFDEALHGLVRSEATAFPQSIGLAATFDAPLMEKVSYAIASECKQRGLRLILSPVINLATDVRWGRVEETYGEDPYLTAVMGTAYVRSFERMGIITTPKHFAVNHGEGGRDSYPIHYSERFLEETYFIPFQSVIQKGGARGMMTAYNSIDGRPCSANNWLLNDKLKTEWRFNGFVISDAGATGGANVLHFTAKDYEEAGKQSVENGLDVIFQTDFSSYDLFKGPFLRQEVDQSKVDSAVARVLRAKIELGLFEHPYVDLQVVGNEQQAIAHRALAKEAALKSVVLLKNDARKVLPLSPEISRIAVIGTDAVEARLGGYSGPGNDPVSVLEGLKQALGAYTEVSYTPGCGRTETTWAFVDGAYLFHRQNGVLVSGLKADYYNNCSLEGTPVVSRIDEQVRFQWTLFSPDPRINYDFFSVKWEGELQAPHSGTYQLGIDGNDGYRLYLDGTLLIDTWNEQSAKTRMVPVTFEKGKNYKLRLEYKESSGNAWFRLIWDMGVNNDVDQRIQEAVKLAKKSDIILMVAGIEEGEFNDRSSLKLPGKQEALILKLAETGKPVVVLLVGGSAITMSNWLDKVNAVAMLWYSGDAGGEAVAELLTGKATPSGKLPITFPQNEGQLPLVYNHQPTGRGDDYTDGSGQPLFPFGYGLSYTTFAYSEVQLDREQIGVSDSIHVQFSVENTGAFDGEEVVQLYLRDELSTVAKPLKELKAFQRVALKKGEKKTVTFTLLPEMLTTLDTELNPVVEPGFFRLMIGSSSKDIRLRTRFEVK